MSGFQTCTLSLLILLTSQASLAGLPARFDGSTLTIDCARATGTSDLSGFRLQLDLLEDTAYQFELASAPEIHGIADAACPAWFDPSSSVLSVSNIDALGSIFDIELWVDTSEDPLILELISGSENIPSSGGLEFAPLQWLMTESRDIEDNPPWQLVPDIFIHEPVAMDVNRDGLPDLIMAAPLYDDGWVDVQVPIRWIQNLGNGEFVFGDQALLPDSAALTHIRHQSIADFNQDGHDDYLAVSHGFDTEPFPGERNILLLSQPDGTLADVSLGNELFDYPGFTHGLDTGDINGDGFEDIVTADLFIKAEGDWGSNIRLLLNNGDGEFTRIPFWYEYADVGKLSVKLADLDGDGFQELIIGGVSWSSGTDYVFWHDGYPVPAPDGWTGTPGAGGHSILPEYFDDDGNKYGDTLAIEALDLDFDGDNDLVLSKSNDYVGQTLRFLINKGDRSFTDATEDYSALTETEWDDREGGPPFWLRALDINLDGLLDMVVDYGGAIHSRHSYIWLRNPDGSFREYPMSNLDLLEYDYGDFVLEYAFWPWLVDHDLDGDLDIVTRYQDYEFLTEDNSPTIRWRILDNKIFD